MNVLKNLPTKNFLKLNKFVTYLHSYKNKKKKEEILI